jgi:hypothetical protein
MRSPYLIRAESGRPSETGTVAHRLGFKMGNKGGTLGLLASSGEDNADERPHGKAWNRLYSELGGRGLRFDQQREEGLTLSSALWWRAVGWSASTATGRRGDR